MGNYVTVATRPHPNIGYDPCPGSPEGSVALADEVLGFAERIDELQVFLQGAGGDLDHAGWAGENRDAFQQAMVEFPPRLREVTGAFDTLQEAVRGWADELETFQCRSLALDADLGAERSVQAQADEARDSFLSGRTGAWTDQDDIDELHRLDAALGTARDGTREVERSISNLESEYRERAVHYGALINAAANRAWGGGFWASVGDFFDGIGDWLEDSPLGDFARRFAGVLDTISEWGTALSLVLGVAGVISIFVFPPAAPFLLGGAAVTGVAAAGADGMLAVSGFGGWGSFAVSVATVGLGKVVTKAGDRIVDIYKATGRQDQIVRVQTGPMAGTYRPSLFTATDMHQDELVWHLVQLKGRQAEWGISGYVMVQRYSDDGAAMPVRQDYSAHEGANPWDLPPNIAYLEDRDGALVK